MIIIVIVRSRSGPTRTAYSTPCLFYNYNNYNNYNKEPVWAHPYGIHHALLVYNYIKYNNYNNYSKEPVWAHPYGIDHALLFLKLYIMIQIMHNNSNYIQ